VRLLIRTPGRAENNMDMDPDLFTLAFKIGCAIVVVVFAVAMVIFFGLGVLAGCLACS
jgi:hypothetical protein